MARPRLLALLSTSLLLLIAAFAAPVTQAGGGCHVADGSVYTEGEGTSVIRMDRDLPVLMPAASGDGRSDRRRR
jgi:hypothetical protein